MNVGVIADTSNGVDWSTQQLMQAFSSRGCQAVLFDVGTATAPAAGSWTTPFPEVLDAFARGCNPWVVRVYPSNPRMDVIGKCLKVAQCLCKAGAVVINPPCACEADYDKALAYERMRREGVPTPDTCMLTCVEQLHGFVSAHGLPTVLKRNTGGRGIGVRLIRSPCEVEVAAAEIPMNGGYIIQAFAKPVKPHDVRICVVHGEVLFSYGRTLAGEGVCGPWMGSCSHGSKVVQYQATTAEREIAVQATLSIGGVLNEVDMQITAAGPVVIENNLTPGYIPGDEALIKSVVDRLLARHT